MNRNIKKLLALVLALVFVATLMTGCGGTKSEDTPAAAEPTKAEATKAEETKAAEAPAEAPGLDTSKKVELVFWMLGGPPKDLQIINDEVNKLTEKDLNCTVKFNMTTWVDWTPKYKLLLTSGQPVDLIFTAEWTDYQRYAKSGAFMALDDIVSKAAPELWSFISKDYWDAVRIDGKIMTMPATWKEYVYDGFEYREDLRKKYGCPEITSLETMEAYLDAIKKNEKGMMPLMESVSGEDFAPATSIVAEMLHPWLDRGMPKYGLAAMDAKPRELYQYWGSAEHKADLDTFKRWADKGFWSRSILSSKEDFAAAFTNGTLAAKMAGINPVKYSQDIVAVQSNHPDWEIGYFPFSKVTGVIHPVHPNHNGFAVPISSQNPDRAVAFFSKLVLDKQYNWLTEYGIEGTHFINDNGYYKMVGDQTTNGFQREGLCGWAWRNPEYQLFDKSFDIVLDMFKEFDTYSTTDIFNGFAEDYTPYQTERESLIQVKAKYLQPLQAGLVKDVDAGLKKFMDEAKKAGIDKIQTEYIKQWTAYCDEMGIK